MSSPFRRSLPSHPDFDQQKKQARELLQSFQAGEPEAHTRVRAQLPDKRQIVLADAQFVLAREYGFTDWAELKQQIETQATETRPPEQQLREAFHRRDLPAIRRLFKQHPAFRDRINDPVFPFDSPALVCYARDAEMVELLLDFGADPNRRSDWWAGGFHPLHSATGAAAERLLAAGAVPDACAAAHLDRPELLASLLAADPARVDERGGDGQTPLHFARSRAVVDLLLAAGADIDARDLDHRATAAEWMLDRTRDAGRYALARYLVDRGASADIFLAAALGLTDRVRGMLETDPTLLALRTGQGGYAERPPSSYHIYFWTLGDSLTPMDVAARFGHRDTLAVMERFATPVQRLLLACRAGDAPGARALVREHPGLIAGMTPADHRALADAAWNGDARAVGLMLELGFDPRTPGHDGGTALHCAAWQGSVEAVEVLLGHPDAAMLVAIADGHYGATPLGWCCHGSLHGNTRHNHARIAMLLLEAGAVVGPDTGNASPAVAVVMERWRR